MEEAERLIVVDEVEWGALRAVVDAARAVRAARYGKHERVLLAMALNKLDALDAGSDT